MESIDKSPFIVSFHSYSVIDPQRFIDEHDKYLSRPNWKDRIGIPKFDAIEKVAPTHQIVVRNPQEVVAIFSPHKDLTIEIESTSLILRKNQSIIFPNSFTFTTIKTTNESDLLLIEVRSIPLCEEFRKLFYFTKFGFFWPIFGTNYYICHQQGRYFIASVSDSTENLIDNFTFTSINDAPIFKLCKRHFTYNVIDYSCVDIYIELSRWKQMGVEENHGEKIHKVNIYSKDETMLNHLKDNNEILTFVYDDNVSLDLTFPISVSLVVGDKQFKNFKQWLTKNYPMITDIHSRTEILPTDEELQNKIINTKNSAQSDKAALEKALSILTDKTIIHPIVLQPGENLSEFFFSREVNDIIFNPKFATHNFLTFEHSDAK